MPSNYVEETETNEDAIIIWEIEDGRDLSELETICVIGHLRNRLKVQLELKRSLEEDKARKACLLAASKSLKEQMLELHKASQQLERSNEELLKSLIEPESGVVSSIELLPEKLNLIQDIVQFTSSYMLNRPSCGETSTTLLGSMLREKFLVSDDWKELFNYFIAADKTPRAIYYAILGCFDNINEHADMYESVDTDRAIESLNFIRKLLDDCPSAVLFTEGKEEPLSVILLPD